MCALAMIIGTNTSRECACRRLRSSGRAACRAHHSHPNGIAPSLSTTRVRGCRLADWVTPAVAIVVFAVVISEPVIAQCELQKLVPSGSAPGDKFGAAVAIDGDLALVGAPGADAPDGTNTGAVYFFRRDGQVWTEEVKVVPDDPVFSSQFGAAVALDGDRALVGAGAGDSADLVVSVYQRSGSETPDDPSDDSWILEAKLTSSGPATQWFGFSVALSGNWIAVGDPDLFGGPGGAVYLYRLDDDGTPEEPGDDAWVEAGKLLPPVPAPSGLDWYGYALHIDEDMLFVGAPEPPWFGRSYVYRRFDQGTPNDESDDEWIEVDQLTQADAWPQEYFGRSVHADGSRVIVGAPLDDDACPGGEYPWEITPDCDSGSAGIFRLDDGGTPDDPTDDTWFEEAKLVPSDTAGGDHFGSRVAIADDIALVTATGDDDACGGESICCYGNGDLGCDDATCEQEVCAINYECCYYDWSGYCTFLAALHCDVCCNSGSVYAFQRDGTTWTEVFKLTAADAGAGDVFGRALAISGNRAIVGAVPYPQTAEIPGAAYVFAFAGDCDANEEVDLCEIADNPSLDLDDDGLLDDCESGTIQVTLAASDPAWVWPNVGVGVRSGPRPDNHCAGRGRRVEDPTYRAAPKRDEIVVPEASGAGL